MLKVLVAKKYNQKSFRKTSLLFIHQTSMGHIASHGIFLLLLRRDWHAGRLVHKQALDGFKCGNVAVEMHASCNRNQGRVSGCALPEADPETRA